MASTMKKIPHHDGITDSAARKLEDFAQYIEKLPKKVFNMSFWGIKKTKDATGREVMDTDALICPVTMEKELKHPCGTACCLAGWAVIRKGMCVQDDVVYKNYKAYKEGTKLPTDCPETAGEILGIPEWDQYRFLFYPWHWPDKFDADTATPKRAAKRIRHFIKTGE